jgi:hypothetical protein
MVFDEACRVTRGNVGSFARPKGFHMRAGRGRHGERAVCELGVSFSRLSGQPVRIDEHVRSRKARSNCASRVGSSGNARPSFTGMVTVEFQMVWNRAGAPL